MNKYYYAPRLYNPPDCWDQKLWRKLYSNANILIIARVLPHAKKTLPHIEKLITKNYEFQYSRMEDWRSSPGFQTRKSLLSTSNGFFRLLCGSCYLYCWQCELRFHCFEFLTNCVSQQSFYDGLSMFVRIHCCQQTIDTQEIAR